jgi:ATP-dependent exoDNAse (exonuclease V) alpha subunit
VNFSRDKNHSPLALAKALNKGSGAGVEQSGAGQIVGSATQVRELVTLLRLANEEQAAIAAGAPYRPYLKLVQQRGRDKKKRHEDLRRCNRRARTQPYYRASAPACGGPSSKGDGSDAHRCRSTVLP